MGSRASALQRLRFYVGGTLRLTSFTVDDSWPGGRVGLVRLTSPTATTLQWDNFKVGQDNGGNGSIDDGGDYVFASYDFGAGHLTLSLGYDNNGNLTDDGSLRYRYDGWNRLVRACYGGQDPNDPNQCFARYSYLADGRRSEKVVTLRGAEAVANDGGNQTVRFVYGSQSPDREAAGQPPWSIFETRNGSNQSTWQYVWGTQYIDEIVFADKNGDPTASNDGNPDNAAAGESSESPADHRYFCHQDRNWNVVAVTDYDSDPNAAFNGWVNERYAFGATGAVSYIVSPSLSLNLAAPWSISTIGAVVLYQGLSIDSELMLYHNRRRNRQELGRFATRDMLHYADSPNLYSVTTGRFTMLLDPFGLRLLVPSGSCSAVLGSLTDAIWGNNQIPPPLRCIGTPPEIIVAGTCPVQGTQYLCNLIQLVSEDPASDVVINPVFGGPTIVDNYQTMEVDLHDLSLWSDVIPPGFPSASTKGQIWVHILAERACLAQGSGFPYCHAQALLAEANQRRSLGNTGWSIISSNYTTCNGQGCSRELYGNRAETWFYFDDGPLVHHEPQTTPLPTPGGRTAPFAPGG